MIFLGQASNYSVGDVLRHIFAYGSKKDAERLRRALAQRYGAKKSQCGLAVTASKADSAASGAVASKVDDDLAAVALYHSGRSALGAAFRALAPKGSQIIIPGLTCIALVRAVRAAGCEPFYADIDPETLQYDWEKLEKILANGQKVAKSPKTIDKNQNVCYNGSIIVAQNTLGLPLDMAKLERIAQKYHLRIVEDLAHSAGRFYPDGREVGTVGSATSLSFGKGKAIDTITGGALVLRDVEAKPLLQPTRKTRPSDRWRDRWYPLLGAIIRGGYHIGLGKVFTAIFLKLHWIQKSADTELNLDRQLTNWQAKLALRQLERLPRTPLRGYQLVAKREKLLQKLREQGYYLDEIWYDTPVAPARYQKEADFPAERCPNTVKVAKEIINLPTWYNERRLAPVRQIIQEWQHE